MNKLYLITGAAGHVGSVLASMLLTRGEHVRLLDLPGSEKYLPQGTENFFGDVRKKETLVPFFDRAGWDQVVLIHCAARITIASKADPAVWETNVTGTKYVMEMAHRFGVDRIIYVSSVHAIPERPLPEIITEVQTFSPDLVHGQYAKSKAAAAQIVLDCAAAGQNVSIVHPSGIIGPGDATGRNHMIRTIRAMASGRIPVSMKGGYDFVDARDVAEGILGCETQGKSGECYILNGHYVTVLDLLNMVRRMVGKKPCRVDLPYACARAAAPAAEWFAARITKEPPLFTPYSVYTLHTNGAFSHEKARKEFGYCPRSMEESVQASL